MANGKGWIDCIDCAMCESIKPWERYCKTHDVNLPDPQTIDHQHTVCSLFEDRHSGINLLNGEVIPEKGGSARYLVYRRGSPHYDSEKPQQMDNGVLYGVHYNEQIIRPLLEFEN